MSRVTKEIAKEVAKKLTANHTDKIEKIGERMAVLAVAHIRNETPKEVTEFYAKYPSYCKTRTNISLRGNTLNQIHLSIEQIPWEGDSSSSIVPDDLGRELQKLEGERDAIQKAKTKLFREIEQTMLSLRTFKKVQGVFPEAAEFLPKSATAYLPVVNLEGIREELNRTFKAMADEQ